MHPRLAGGVAASVCLLLVLLGLTQGRVYKAESRVFVDPLVPGSISPSNGQPGFDQFRYGSYLDQQIQTVTRADVLVAALRAVPAGTWRGPKESEQSAVARLQKALVVERLTDGYEFSIKLSTPKPQASADLLRAVTNAYLQSGRRDELTEADGREQILLEEQQRIRDLLKNDQDEQAALGTNLGVANPAGEAGNPFDLQLNNLRTQLATAREAHDVAEAQLSALTGSDANRGSGLVAAADDSINTDMGLSSMKASINQRRALLQGLMAGMTPTNPQYKQDQDEIADLDRLLDGETAKMRGAAERRIEDKLRADLQRTAAVEAQLNEQLARETARATGAGPKLLRASELATDIRRLNDRLTDVDINLHSLQLQTDGPGVAHVTLQAAVPSAPEPNRSNLFLMAALPLGALCGIVAAVFARLRERRVYLATDVEEALGFPPLVVLPARADVPQTVSEEYLLRFAAGVEGAYRRSGARTFLVTAVSGKTFTHGLVQALASKLEELRLKVVVLGAVELLLASAESAEYLSASEKRDDRVPAAGDGIATAKLERFKAEYDLVLIDGAPLLHAAESEYAARCADATILVVESGVTLAPDITQAANLLSRLQASGVAVVLQELKLRDADEPFKAAIKIVEERNVPWACRQPPSNGRRPNAASDAPRDAEHTPPPILHPLAAEPSPGPLIAEPEDAEPAPLAVEEERDAAPATGGHEARFEQEFPLLSASFADAIEPRPVSGFFGNQVLEPVVPWPTARGWSPEALQVDSVEPAEVAVAEVAEIHDRPHQGSSYTRSRSKIHFAFTEEEVNSKTTWFSKLFRGDPPSHFKVVPDEEEPGQQDAADAEWNPIEDRSGETLAPAPVAHAAEASPVEALKRELTPEQAADPRIRDEFPHPVIGWEIPWSEALEPPAGRLGKLPVVATEALASSSSFPLHPPEPSRPLSDRALDEAGRRPTTIVRPLRPLTFEELAEDEPEAEAVESMEAAPIEEAGPDLLAALPHDSSQAAFASAVTAPRTELPTTIRQADARAAETSLERNLTPTDSPAGTLPLRPMLHRLAARLEAVQPRTSAESHASKRSAAPMRPLVTVPAQPGPQAAPASSGLSRRWALLSRYDTTSNGQG
jgi:uncharacterized protein involved in exopolysaccharide biosynthesis